jgi:hypothetical protein
MNEAPGQKKGSNHSPLERLKPKRSDKYLYWLSPLQSNPWMVPLWGLHSTFGPQFRPTQGRLKFVNRSAVQRKYISSCRASIVSAGGNRAIGRTNTDWFLRHGQLGQSPSLLISKEKGPGYRPAASGGINGFVGHTVSMTTGWTPGLRDGRAPR